MMYCHGCEWPLITGMHDKDCTRNDPPPPIEVSFYHEDRTVSYRTLAKPLPLELDGLCLHWTDGQVAGDRIVPYYRKKTP